MNLIEAVTGFLIFTILILSFMPTVMSLDKINPTVNLSLTNAVESQLYGVNDIAQQYAQRKDCSVSAWSNLVDKNNALLVVQAMCKGQSFNVGRFVYGGQ